MTFALRQQDPHEQKALAADAYARWRSPEGEVVATFHHVSAGYLVRFIDSADFQIAPDREEVTCVPVPGTSPQAIEDLFLNQVMPMVHAQAGGLVIHASAVAIAGGIVGFVGATGRGKSTLAAAFARSAVPFLSDDGIALVREGEHYTAMPNRPTFRLWQDSEAAVIAGETPPEESADEKSRVVADASLPFQAEPLPLRALYFLGEGASPEPVIQPMTGHAALAELINHAFLLDVGDKVRLRSHFEALADLSETVPAFALDYPRDYAWLDRVMAAIVEHSSREDQTT